MKAGNWKPEARTERRKAEAGSPGREEAGDWHRNERNKNCRLKVAEGYYTEKGSSMERSLVGGFFFFWVCL